MAGRPLPPPPPTAPKEQPSQGKSYIFDRQQVIIPFLFIDRNKINFNIYFRFYSLRTVSLIRRT